MKKLIFIFSILSLPAIIYAKAPVGMNINTSGYPDPAQPFKNLFLLNAGFTIVYATSPGQVTGETIIKDINGYPTSLPAGRYYNIDIGRASPGIPYGAYTLFYDGIGTMTFSGIAATGGNGIYNFSIPLSTLADGSPFNGPINFYITAEDPVNYVKNIRLYYAGWGDDNVSIYNPTFLSVLRPFHGIRYLDWELGVYTAKTIILGYTSTATATTVTLTTDTAASSVNNFYNGWVFLGSLNRNYITGYDGTTKTVTVSPAFNTIPVAGQYNNLLEFYKDWSGRTIPTFASIDDGTNEGPPWEFMIQLSNELGIEPYFNIPSAASDDYIRQLAILVKANLNPAFKIHLQYSNETWDTTQQPNNWISSQGLYLGISDYTPYRAVQIFKIWNEVFGMPDLSVDRVGLQDPLIRMLSAQGVLPDSGAAQMDFTLPGEPFNGHKAYEFADAYASDDYYSIFNDDEMENLTLNQLFSLTQQDMQPGPGGSNGGRSYMNRMVGNYNNVVARGLRLMAYEGGTSSAGNTPARSAKLYSFAHDPRLGTLVAYNLYQWNSLGSSASDWFSFNIYGRQNPFGDFGFIDQLPQDVNVKGRKYPGLIDYISPPTIAPIIVQQPALREGSIVGSTASFSFAVIGGTSFQWQESTGTGFFNISTKGTSPFYDTPILVLGDNGEQFKCIVTNASGSITTNTILLDVTVSSNPPSILSNPTDEVIVEQQIATFTVVSSGTFLNYQWQTSTGIGGAFRDVYFGGNAASYNVVLSTINSGNLFRAVVSNTLGISTSTAATVTVNAGTRPPSIITQPINLAVGAGAPAYFVVVATGAPPMTYQWKTNGSDVGTNTPSYLTPITTIADSGEIITCTITNGFGSATTTDAILTVDAIPGHVWSTTPATSATSTTFGNATIVNGILQ